MRDPYLLLWLEAPMQSWGCDSKFSRRETLDFPTKSGVLGLLLCALGAGGAQEELLAELADLDMQAAAYALEDRRREPLLMDFHMVGSGYNAADKWQSLLIPRKSDGTKAVGGGTKMTYRYYVQDMAFAVLLQVPAAKSQAFGAALGNPVWDLFLGRKSCAPTDQIYRGAFDTADGAFAEAETIASGKKRKRLFRVLQGEFADQDDPIVLNDVPIAFGECKRYRDRRVTIIRDE
jgi:CRISPR system Cascade subunit CasD